MIDSKGRLFSKISIFDILVILMIIGLAIGLTLKLKDSPAPVIISSGNTTFYTTFTIEPVRDFSVNAIQEGDLFMEQFGASLGKVAKKRVEDAYEIMHKDDGTATLAKMEQLYRVYLTLECTGTVNDSGYYVNGNRQVSKGTDLFLKSNMLFCGARVYSISDTLE